eukprot:Skav231876  [mRNA]  locus=scaffold54:141135:141833:- [translate_table: standard]
MLDDDVKRNIFEVLTCGPEEVRLRRQATLAKYKAKAEELERQEDEIHSNLPTDRARILEGKRLLLFKLMCQDAGIEEAGDLMELQLVGTPLTGKSAPTTLFEEDTSEPALTEEQLMESSRWSRPMLKSRGVESAGLASQSEVWDVTLQETEKGWLDGPHTEEEMRRRHGPLFISSPRFGLVQNDKLRPIDDLSISLVNSAFSPGYKLDLSGVDGIAILCRTLWPPSLILAKL